MCPKVEVVHINAMKIYIYIISYFGTRGKWVASVTVSYNETGTHDRAGRFSEQKTSVRAGNRTPD